MTIKTNLMGLAEGSITEFDPHSNIAHLMDLTPDGDAQVDYLYDLMMQLIDTTVPGTDLHSGNASETRRLEILTKAVMAVPFDYTGNAIKTAKMMRDQGDSFISLDDTLEGDELHYLRTPTEVLEGYLTQGMGGDCFSTSLLAQTLFAAHGLKSKLVTCYDDPSSAETKDRHHLAVVVEADGQQFYVDTSLNIEVPIEFSTGKSDSGDKSSIFRLRLVEEDGIVKVSYVEKPTLTTGARTFAGAIKRNLIDGGNRLWHFETEGNPLADVIPSMLYTLHPDVPAGKGLKLNKNEQLRYNVFSPSPSPDMPEYDRRERVYYSESVGAYLSRAIGDQKPHLAWSLGAGHDPETRKITGDIEGLVAEIHAKIGVQPDAVRSAINAVNYINSR